MSDDAPIHYQLLHDYVGYALNEQRPDVAMAAAKRLNAGAFDIIALFDVDDDGEPKPDSLAYRVDVEAAGVWVPIVKVHWSRLRLEWADVLHELRNVKRQHDEGTYPGGPDDPAS